MSFRRAIIIVLDGVGIGEAPDAPAFGDEGSNTLVNMAKVLGGLKLPNLERLGLGNITSIPGVAARQDAIGGWGKMAEMAAGKDTQSGHWEMMGVILRDMFPTYPDGFPAEVLDPFVARTGRGVLGNKPASGTDILDELGPEHQATGKWIVYTSGDSVFQLAAHTDVAPLDELYRACEIARHEILQGPHRVGRVIARPFAGRPGQYERLNHARHDYSVDPPGATALDQLVASGLKVTGIGKIGDIFNHKGLSQSIHADDNADGMRKTLQAVRELSDHQVIFTNLVDFDAKYGHRNNPQGMAEALAAFDQFLGDLLPALQPGDLLMLTADHGNDPTDTSTDHTREYVPIVTYSPDGVAGGDLGTRATFADIAATLEANFRLPKGDHPGRSLVGAL